MKKRFCRRGHDILFYGRYKDRRCCECTRLRDMEPQARARRSASVRRSYLANREERIRRAIAWGKAHPARKREIDRAYDRRRYSAAYWALQAQVSQ